MIERSSAGLAYALGWVQATQGEQAAHFFFPMTDLILLHEVHEFKGFGPDLLLNTLGVVFWSVHLFVRWQVRILRHVSAFVIHQRMMQGYFLPVM